MLEHYCEHCGSMVGNSSDALVSVEIKIKDDNSEEIIGADSLYACEKCAKIYEGVVKTNREFGLFVCRYSSITGKKYHHVRGYENHCADVAIGMAKSGRLFD